MLFYYCMIEWNTLEIANYNFACKRSLSQYSMLIKRAMLQYKI